MEKLSIKEIAEAVGGVLYGEDGYVCDVCTDNRLAKEGSLFAAIAGENHDGHSYAKAACENGASAVLISRDVPEVKASKIMVADTKKALGKLAEYYLDKIGAKVLAVTGSVGKTTTRNMAYAAVSKGLKAIKTIKNYNNDIGLPLTVLTQLERTHDTAVLEMGMNHFGEISYLSKLAKPSAAIITNIGMSHIENLGSREGILKAKLEICDGMKKDGVLFLNGDDEYLVSAADKLDFKVRFYAVKNKNADYRAENITHTKDGVSFDLCCDKGRFKVLLGVPGEHNVYNALASFAAAVHFGVSPDDAISGLEEFCPENMRMEIINKENLCIINDCYNASPDSVKAAAQVLANMENKRKIAVLGDMLEMGSFAPAAHEETGKYVAERADAVICTGELGKYIKEGAGAKGEWFESKEAVISRLKAEKGDCCILIKASRGMHFEDITNAVLGK